MGTHSSRSHCHSFHPLAVILQLCILSSCAAALKCLDCVGADCMGRFCEGEYCMVSRYAPRWGTLEWGSPKVVKGCASGTMLRKDIREHCETDEDGEDDFTCFCDGRDNCNGGKSFERLEREPIELVKCVCRGEHCTGSTCLGQLCSYVYNHKTKKSEQGCVNETLPMVERRTTGACIIPPATGAMHHTIAKDAESLLHTESCVCAQPMCNRKKPQPKVKEAMRCPVFVRVELMGTKMESKNTTCRGEFCFNTLVKAKLGSMSEYVTSGCASFASSAELAEELEPVGCASFRSEKVDVETCFRTDERAAIRRAEQNREGGSKKGARRKEEEEEEEEDQKEEDNEGDEEKPRRKPDEVPPEDKEEVEEEEEEEEENEGKGKDGGKTAGSFIWAPPTEAPVHDDGNGALIAVFLLLILFIALGGIVYKFELHKKLFRANYDSVAGG